MSEMPNTMKLGMAMAFLGAIGAFASMAMAWTGFVESAPIVGLDMLAAMVFFAVAGCFSTYSPVKGSTVVILSALSIAFTVIAAIFGAMNPIVCVILVIFGIICMFCGNLDSTKDYIEANRLV